MSSGGATLQGSYSGETGTIDEVGFYYGSSTGNLPTKVAATGTGSPFSKAITGLSAGATYYYKAYVHEYNESTSSYEYRYGDESNFTTLAVSTATVTTSAASAGSTTATLNGSYTDASGAISEVGFFWSSSQATVNTLGGGTKVVATGTSSPFSKGLTGLTASTTYYYRAYAKEYNESTSSYDFKYGSVVSFTTTSGSQATNLNANTLNHGYIGAYEVPAISGATHSKTATYATNDDVWHRYNTSSSKQKVVTHTFSYNASRNRTFTLLQDYDKKCAMWVAFAMHASAFPWLVDRDDSWKADPAFNATDGLADWQPDLTSAYQNGSTYSRGHQCASNDRRTTTAQTHQTNYFTNMTPQISGFNGGVWATLEGNVQTVGKATTGRDTLYVVTGPLFQDNPVETNPDKNGMECAIPTHYYKCLMKVSFDAGGNPTSAVGCAYLMVHASGSAQQVKTIDYIESLAGFDFFANVPDSIEDEAEAMTYSFW